jgi:hypothetical protein
MKQFISKMKQRWSNFSSDHPHSSKLMITGGGVGAGGTGLTAYIIWVALTSTTGPGTYGVYAVLAGASLIGAATVAAIAVIGLAAAGMFFYEKKKNKEMSASVDKNGQKIEGPRWVIKRLEKANATTAKLAGKFNALTAKHEAGMAAIAENVASLSQQVTVASAAKL